MFGKASSKAHMRLLAAKLAAASAVHLARRLRANLSPGLILTTALRPIGPSAPGLGPPGPDRSELTSRANRLR